MKHYRCITVMIGVVNLVAAIVWAQDRITEEDIVSTLNGKPRAAAQGQLPSIALHVTFPLQPAASVPGNRALSSGIPQTDEAFYKTLIPLARALEAGGLRGARFVVRVRSSLPLPIEHANRLGRQLADTVEHFLTTHFAIPRERLSLQVAQPQSTAEEPGTPPQASQRWRLEVLRQE